MENKNLIEKLERKGYLRSEEVKRAFLEVERREFVPEKYKREAYSDTPLPIGSGQTISAPHMVAMMTEILEPEKEDKTLEIGTGSGYQAAVLSKLVEKVITLERIPELFKIAKKNLKGYENVEVMERDGSKGYEEKSPYDNILVTCAAPELPKALKEQLKENGKILIPLGNNYTQELYEFIKKDKGFEKRDRGTVRFVPMRGEMGF